MADKKLPDLEAIAKKLTSIEEDFKIGEITPRISDAYNKAVRYKDNAGTVRYKHDFSDDAEGLDKLSNAIFDALSEHVHLLEFNIKPGDYRGMKAKNSAGTAYTDVAVQNAFGITRSSLRNSLDKFKDKLTLDAITGLVNKQVEEKYVPQKQGEIVSDLKDEHVGHIREYITQQATDRKLTGYKKGLDKHYTVQDILPKFLELAKVMYKK